MYGFWEGKNDKGERGKEDIWRNKVPWKWLQLEGEGLVKVGGVMQQKWLLASLSAPLIRSCIQPSEQRCRIFGGQCPYRPPWLLQDMSAAPEPSAVLLKNGGRVVATFLELKLTKINCTYHASIFLHYPSADWQCICCLGGETESWCSLLLHLPGILSVLIFNWCVSLFLFVL